MYLGWSVLLIDYIPEQIEPQYASTGNPAICEPFPGEKSAGYSKVIPDLGGVPFLWPAEHLKITPISLL
jgi:hypothetical protein